MTLNKMQIIGYLGRDPEMRYTPSGDAVTNFSVAVGRRYRNRDGQDVDETEWFNVSAWRRLAETTNQYLTKGSKVYVEGRLQSRSYVAQDGQTRFSNDINALEVVFLDRPGQVSGGQTSGGQTSGGQTSGGQTSGGQTSGDPGFAGGPPPEDDADDLPW